MYNYERNINGGLSPPLYTSISDKETKTLPAMHKCSYIITVKKNAYLIDIERIAI